MKTTDTLITLDPLLMTFVAGALIPVITALTTKINATDTFRVLISLFLSTLSGALIQVNNSGGTFYLKQTLVAASVTFATAVVSYQGWWKPVVSVNQKALPNVGLTGLTTVPTAEDKPAGDT